jgi:translocation and assembly module TamB
MRNALRVVAVLLAALLAVYASLVVVMSTAWFHRFLRQQVISHLEAITGARAEIAAMDFDPLILEVSLRGLVLHGTEPASEPPLLTARTVVIGIDPVSLSRRGLRLRSLDVEGADAHLETYPDGSTNLPGPPAGREGLLSEWLDLSVDRVTFNKTVLVWDDHPIPLNFNARNVALLMGFRRDRSIHSVLGLLRPLRHYSGSFSSSEVQIKHPSLNLPPLSLACRFDLSRDGLTIPSLVWRSKGIAKRGESPTQGEGSIELSWRPSLTARASLHGEGSASTVAQIFRLKAFKGGSISWSSQVNYVAGALKAPPQLDATGNVQGRSVTFESLAFASGPVSFTANYAASLNRLLLPRFRVELLAGEIAGKGEADWHRQSFALHAQLRELDLAESLSAVHAGEEVLHNLQLDATVNGTVEATGKGSPESVRFDLQFDPRMDLHRTTTHVLEGMARGTVQWKPAVRVNLDRVELRTPQSALSARGILSSSQSMVTARLTTTNFEEWRPLVEAWCGASRHLPVRLQSTLVLDATWSALAGRPHLGGGLRVGAFEYANERWDGAEAGISGTPALLQASGGRLFRGSSTVAFAATIGLEGGNFTPQSPVHLAVQANWTPLRGLGQALGLSLPLEGQLTGRLEATGTRSDLKGSGSFKVFQGEVAAEPFDILSAHVTLAGASLSLPDIALTKGPGQMTGQASIDLQTGRFSALVRGSGFRLASFHRLAGWTGTSSANQPSLDGRVQFDARAHGTFERPQLDSEFAVNDLHLSGQAAGGLEGQLHWQDWQLWGRANLSGAGGTLSFNVTARTEGSWPFQLEGRYTDLRLDPWINLAEAGRVKAVIVSSGSLRAAGPLRDPGQISGHLQAQTLSFSFAGNAQWKNVQPVELSFSRGMLTVAPFFLRGPSTDLEVQGTVRPGIDLQPGTVSLVAHGQADAKLLELFDPTLQSTGNFALDLHVSGAPSHPLLGGHITVKDVGLAYADLPFRLAGLNGVVDLQGNRANLFSVRGVTGQGAVNLTGSITLGWTPRFDLRADLSRAPVQYPAEFTSVLDGRLRLTGTPENTQLNGLLTVKQMYVSEDFDLLRWMTQMAAAAAQATSPTLASPAAARVHLNIAVASEPEVRLESHNLTATASIDLRLRGTAANPVALGTVRLLSGRALVRNNEFTVTRGEITFADPYRTRPVLDVEARTRVQAYDLTLDLSGPPDRMRLSYRSDPPLPAEDIPTLLALGTTLQAQPLAGGLSSQRSFSSVGASALLSQALSTQVSSRVQRIFGVSRIRIDPNVNSPVATGGARVTVEEQVARNLTLTYVTNTSSQYQERIFQFEWDLSDHTSLIGVRDQNGVYGLELRFRRRLK